MSHDKKTSKTNAARLLDELGISYSMHEAEVDLDDLSAVSMAAKLGEDKARVFKTLVTRSDRNSILMACIPADAELDLKALARASGNKQVAMVHLKEVFPLTGYVRGGCSPIGMKKAFPTVIDRTAQDFETIIVSAGKIGVQAELAPNDLRHAANAEFGDITQ